ncbi:GNAT family N-acetyltransferase, partial [Streptomyces sp. NPDC059744]
MTMDADVQSHARTLAQRSPDHLRIGPFTVRHNPDWQLKYANYAIPDQGAEPTAADVQALIAAFRERDRMPRLEYLPGGAPAVEPALRAAGFTVENRAPILACALGDLQPPKPGVARVNAQTAPAAGFVAPPRGPPHREGGAGA